MSPNYLRIVMGRIKIRVIRDFAREQPFRHMGPKDYRTVRRDAGPPWYGASQKRRAKGGTQVATSAQLQVAGLRDTRIDFDQESFAGIIFNHKVEPYKPGEAETPHDFIHGSIYLRILHKPYHRRRPVGTSRLQHYGRNLCEDLALPTRQRDVGVSTGHESLRADERPPFANQTCERRRVAVHQDSLKASSRNPLRSQLAKCALRFRACLYNSHALTAGRAVCFQYCW